MTKNLQRNLPEHLAGLLSGLDVDEEILQEHLRRCGGHLSVCGLVVREDVYLLIDDCSRRADHHGLAVGPGNAAALRGGSHDDEPEVVLHLRGGRAAGK